MRTPDHVTYHRRSKVLELRFGDKVCSLPAELLRVYSPSAEVRGHSEAERKLQTGKKHVTISGIEPVGNYALRLSFDDGHDSGLFAWDYLEDLADHQERYMHTYMAELKSANASRLPTIPVGHYTP